MVTLVALGVVVAMLAGTVLAVREPGPNRGLVLAHRYGVVPVVVGLSALAALAAVAFGRSTLVAALIGLAVWGVILAMVAGWLTPTHVWSGVRRAVLRARWPSVSRSCGLAVLRDRRSPVWLGGDTVDVGSKRVEYLPTISFGRALPDSRGVAYRLRPARGGTLAEIAEHAEALAAGLRVHRVEVERHRPDRGRLVVIWRDPLHETVAPPTPKQVVR